jgi:hypothetical protein
VAGGDLARRPLAAVFSAEGRDTIAAFRYSLEERALKEMLAGHPTEDIGGSTSA